MSYLATSGKIECLPLKKGDTCPTRSILTTNGLGSRPKDQPPNHYRLLGLEAFESDPEVIESAADQQ